MKSYGMAIQMKAAVRYPPVVLFITLYKLLLTFESVGEILKCDRSNKATEQHFLVVPFIMLSYRILQCELMW